MYNPKDAFWGLNSPDFNNPKHGTANRIKIVFRNFIAFFLSDVEELTECNKQMMANPHKNCGKTAGKLGVWAAPSQIDIMSFFVILAYTKLLLWHGHLEMTLVVKNSALCLPCQCWKQDQYFQTKTKIKTKTETPRPRPQLQSQDQDQDRCIRTSIRIKLSK